MPIPTYDAIMLPLLRYCQDEAEHTLGEAIEVMAKHFQLTADELEQRTPSNRHSLMYNRLCWAKTYLKKAGLIEQPKRGCFSITERGKTVLASHPDTLTPDDLSGFEGFDEFHGRHPKKDTNQAQSPVPNTQSTPTRETPEEALYNQYQFLRAQAQEELLDLLKSAEPIVLENVVIELMRAMGFGDSREDAAQAIGKTNDRGVDGVIHMDRLGLDRVYLQAKRYQNSVGSPEIRNFGGALDQHKASKGVFITTGSFTSEARLCAKEMSRQIVLIDGERSANLMLTYNIGAKPKDTLVLHDVDASYFKSF